MRVQRVSGGSLDIYTLRPVNGLAVGHRRFPAAEQLSDEENEDPGLDPTATVVTDATYEADAAKSSAERAGRLENCMLVWRYESCAVEAHADVAMAEAGVAATSPEEHMPPTVAAAEERT